MLAGPIGTRGARGQTMVLFVLTLLLLTLMVCVTLGIGMKIREKNELQTVADTAAYSQAVVAARMYNNAAIINRLSVSYFVAIAASESLISWTGGARGALYEGATAANLIALRNTPPCLARNVCACAKVASARAVATQLGAAATATWAQWHNDDHTAGFDTEAIQGAIAGLRAELFAKTGFGDATSSTMTPPSGGTMLAVLQNHTLAKDIVKLADRGSVVSGELSVVPENVSHREVDCRVSGTWSAAGNGTYSGAPGLCMNGGTTHTLPAAMGSRGNGWVRSRGTPPDLMKYLATYAPGINAAGNSVTITTDSGTGTWGTSKHDVSASSTAYAWGDDHMQVRVVVNPPCGSDTQTRSYDAWLKSTDISDQSDKHIYPGSAIENDEKQWHTFGSCGNSCPSVWVSTLNFIPSTKQDNWGQPKTYSVIERDYGKRGALGADPWNLFFRFRFTRGTAGTEFDNRGIQLSDGTDISKALAVSTGLAYYHRPGHWREFPNLLNPFWRATLVSADTDAQGQLLSGGKDVSNLLASNPWQKNAYEELVKAGFKGLP